MAWNLLQMMYMYTCTYSLTTETGVTQTMLTNHRAEREQYIPTFANWANQMSSTQQWNDLFTREAYEYWIQCPGFSSRTVKINCNIYRRLYGWVVHSCHTAIQMLYRSTTILLASFRPEDEYEIEYEYDFSNAVRRVYINMSNTNLVPRDSFSTGQQQGGAKALGT